MFLTTQQVDNTSTVPHSAFLLSVFIKFVPIFISLWMYTMNRCFSFALLPLLWAITASAQSQDSGIVLSAPENGVVTQPGGGRSFPANALRGYLRVLQGAEVMMDGQAARLSPGSRIRGTSNTLVMPGTLVGQEYIVNFTRDTLGNVHNVWLLTELEAKQKIKTATPERNFIFASEGDKPKTDDGKTPFNQLPKFKN